MAQEVAESMGLLQRQISDGLWWTGMLLVVLASTCLSIAFATVQSIWGDEATHLAGLTLPLGELLDWLGGHDPFRFGVPPDRMPPLGYVLGGIWANFFGREEFAMRMFGLVASLAGLAFLGATLRRISQSIAALMALGLYALSLNYVQYSVEIRPYPLVLMLASAMIYCAGQYISADDPRGRRLWLILLTLCGIAGVYIHYTTLVFSLSILGALGLLALYDRRGFWPVLIAAVIVALSVGPLVPLILASMQVKTAVLQTEWRDIPRYFARLFSSRPEAVLVPVMGAVMLSKLSAIGAMLACKPSRFQTIMLITVLSGISGMMLSAFIVPGSMLQPHYSIWVLPALFTLMLLPSRCSMRWASIANSGALAVAVACLAGSMLIFLPHMQSFSHGPAQQIAAAIDRAPVDSTIVYDYGEDAWWNTFYPVRLTRGTTRRQVLVLNTDTDITYYNPDDYMPNLNGVRMAELPNNPLQTTQSIVLIRARSFDLSDMRRYIFDQTPNLESSTVERKLAEINGYKIVSEEFVPGTTSARIVLMSR